MRENGTASDQPLDNVILSRMRAFAGMNKLKKEALRIIATGISAEEIAGLRSIFQVHFTMCLAGTGAALLQWSPACIRCLACGVQEHHVWGPVWDCF